MSDLDVKGFFAGAKAKVDEIDAQLDAAEGNKGAGKRAVRNALVAKHSDQFGPVVENMEQNVSLLEGEQLVAFVTIVARTLAKFDDAVDAILAGLVPETSDEVSTLSDDEKKKLGETRKKLFGQLKQLREMAELMGEDVEDMILPARRNVASGPRGKQALSTYIYEIEDANGNTVELEEDASLNDIAKKYDFKNSAALRAALRDGAVHVDAEGGKVTGIDTSTPPARFEFTFDNGDVLVAAAPISE